jgi:hypothetical protein
VNQRNVINDLQPTCVADYTGLQKKYYFSVTSTKVGELNSIFYVQFKFVLSFSISRKVL